MQTSERILLPKPFLLSWFVALALPLLLSLSLLSVLWRVFLVSVVDSVVVAAAAVATGSYYI